MINDNVTLIAVDSGKDSTKFIFNDGLGLQRSMFRTKVQKVENFGVDVEKNTFLVEYNGENYLIGDMVGENKLNFDLTKKSIEHKLAIYVAIAKVLKKVESNKVKIAIGAPLNIYKNAKLKEEYREYIFNNGHVSLKVNKEMINFEIDDVLVLPEGIGPIYMSMAEYKTKTTIVDIGGLNTNICRFNNLVPDVNTMLVANKGGNILKSKIADALTERYGVIIYNADVEEILKDNGVVYLNGKPQNDSKGLIEKIMKEHLLDIINFAKQNELDILSTNGKVVFTGGGSLLLKEIIQRTYSHAKFSNDAQFSNALAFYKVLAIKNGQA